MPESCGSSWIEVLKALSPVISWGLIIAGWKVVSADHNKRERRKEIRAAINALSQQIRNCEEKSHEYWMLSEENDRAKILSVAIKRDLQRISVEWFRVQSDCKIPKSHQRLIAFRRSITAGDFEVKGRGAAADNSEKILRISDAAIDLIDALEDGFSNLINAG